MVRIVTLESITGVVLGILAGYIVQFIVVRMYNNPIGETNLFVVTPFLLYFFCDNNLFDLNGIFALVAFGLSCSSLKYTYHNREAVLPAQQVWNYFNFCAR